MLRGISTISFYAADLVSAQSWYTELLGFEPYFQRPGYIEFRIGDHQQELGIIDARYAPYGVGTAAGAVVFWHVDDLSGSLDRLLAAGATLHEGITERGEGFVTGSVVDPFGNLLGVMTNPHYLEMLAERPPA